MLIDITNEDLSPERIDDEVCSRIYVCGGQDNIVLLVLGSLTIKMTQEQEERLRYYYENT